MKKIVLIGSREHGEKNSIQVMEAYLNTTFNGKYQVLPVYFEDLLFNISKKEQSIIDASNNVDLRDADMVVAVNWYKNGDLSLYRDVAYSVALYLEQNKVPFWNREMLRQRSTTKLSAMILLALNGVDVPKTYFSLSAKVLRESTNPVYPLILKGTMASRGRSNFLINNQAELDEHTKQSEPINKLMIQEFIANEGDYRVVCFDSKPKVAIYRRGKGNTHLNNASQGADVKLVSLDKLPNSVLEDCQKICELMERNIAGVDILPAADGSGRYVCLEVNAIPQLTSGSFVDTKLSEMAIAITNVLEGN
jgi:glutathione synthase/RimK-type ligase-like ATP-grasp enzyme